MGASARSAIATASTRPRCAGLVESAFHAGSNGAMTYPSATGRSAAARPSSAEFCGLSTAPDGEPNINTAVCSLDSGVAARTAIQYPGHWNLDALAIGTRPTPRPASHVRHCATAARRFSSCCCGTSSSGISKTEDKHARNESTVRDPTVFGESPTSSMSHSDTRYSPGVSRWMDDAVESYLTELAKTEHEEPVLVDMEARAAEHGFPIVGRATGRFLELAARAVRARRVMELGSGYGYSAYWFARAVGRTERSSAPTAIQRTPGWQRTTSAGQACGTGCDIGSVMRCRGSRRKRATSTSCTAMSTRMVTRTAGARPGTASASVACGCVTTRFGAGTSQPQPTSRASRG